MAMLRLFFVLTLLCGVIYPLLVTGISQIAFPHEANGSLLREGDKIVGSSLLAQKFTSTSYFHPRPSAGDYATVASGASQHSPTHKAGTAARLLRQKELPLAAVDAWTTSASGLDPHISPSSAWAQIPHVAAARGLSPEVIRQLVEAHTKTATWGIWGQPRVNVLELNLALNAQGKDGNAGQTSH